MLRVRSLENDFVESAILEPFPLLALLETIVTSNLAALQWSLVLSCPEVSGEERDDSVDDDNYDDDGDEDDER